MLGVIFIAMVVMLVLTVPIGVMLLVVSLIPNMISPDFTASVPFVLRNVVGGLNSTPLLAIPLFILGGLIMAQSGIAEKLFDIFAYLIGDKTGGMPCASIITCLFYGAISGSAPATTASVGTMTIPILDAHLKVQDKCEVFDDYLQRRLSVIQAFLAQMNAKDKAFVDACGSLIIEPEIVPFMIEDEAANVNLLLSATGQKAICSRKTAVQQLGWVNDTDAEIEQIEAEESAASYSSIYEPTV